MAAWNYNSPHASPADLRDSEHLDPAEQCPASDARDRGDCPPVEQLWPVAVDETPVEWVARHLESCSDCRARTRELSREIAQARSLLSDSRSYVGSPAVSDDPLAADQFPQRIVTEFFPESLAETETCETATRPVAVIGKYFVLETLCDSGQATVFRGLHPSLLIDVVIKLAHDPWRHDETGRARLVSEAKALAEIVHPHLARLYDLDFNEDRPFLVLEYVRGRHLRHYRESTALEPSQIAFLVAKVARAVAAAHERGILHLDLKPENILVTFTGEPVLIDFGLSFLSPCGEMRSLEGRCIAGTPEYMSPEQTHGVRVALTQRTDVYGLGGVLYYLCVGHDPFAVSREDGQLRRPEEPDWRALAQSNVPARLKAICRKALSTAPELRYSTAESLAETLEDAGRRWTGPARKRLRKIASAMFLAGTACLIAAAFAPSHQPLEPTTMTLRIVRAGQDLPVTDAIPLGVDDRIRLEGLVGESAHVAAFAVSGARSPQWLGPLRLSADRGGTRVVFPGFSDSVPLCRTADTLLVVLVSRRDAPIRRQHVAQWVPPDSRLSSLRRGLIVIFGREQCEIHVRPGTRLTDTQTNDVRRQIRLLQTELSRRFDDFAAVLVAGSA